VQNFYENIVSLGCMHPLPKASNVWCIHTVLANPTDFSCEEGFITACTGVPLHRGSTAKGFHCLQRGSLPAKGFHCLQTIRFHS